MVDFADEASVRTEASIMAALSQRDKITGDLNPRDCLSCGEPIPLKRIQAIPSTKLCIDCASDLNG